MHYIALFLFFCFCITTNAQGVMSDKESGTALLIVDIQNDYFPGGAMELVGSQEAGKQAKQLLAAFREKNMPVIHIQHISMHPGATFFLPGTKGAEIHECVFPRQGETIIQKHFPSSFRNTTLLEHLRDKKIHRLVIIGMMTHMCIDTTTRAAADLGFECFLCHDACATRDLSFNNITIPAKSVHNAFLASLNGVFARVFSVKEFCEQWK